jgi:hypothetical protein
MSSISLKRLLFENTTVPVCMVCEKISPRRDVPENQKSHGLCREHYIAFMTQATKRPMSLDDARKSADRIEAKNKTKGIALTVNTSGAKETDPLPEMS